MRFNYVASWLVAGGLLLAGTPVFAQARVDPYLEFLVARHLEGEGDAAGALAALERAAAADPSSAEIPAEMAALHLRRNERDDALKTARAALAIDKANVEANRVVGLIEAQQAGSERTSPAELRQLVDSAIGHLELATAGTVGLPDANVNYTLGRLYMATSQPDKAVQALQRVIVSNPGTLQGRLALAQAQAATKNLQGAIQTLEEVADDEPRVLGPLAQYEQEAGMPAEAAATYTKALADQPNSRELKARRILALYEAKDFAKAAEYAADAAMQHPDDSRFLRLQASALFAEGQKARAVQVLESAVKQYPKDTAAQLALVDMYSSVGRKDDAERQVRQLLSIDPNNADALNFLGYMLANRGERLDEAIRLVNEALKQDPENGAYLDSLGWAYFRRGDLDQAEKYITQAASRLPMNGEIQDHLGDLQARRGHWQDAIAAWTQALRGDGADVDRASIEKKISDAKGKLQNAR
jgi:tetratricopeptide (TPR) repeat protein